MRAFAFLFMLALTTPAAAKQTCHRESTRRVVQVAAALLSSPTWIDDLDRLSKDLSQRRVDCMVSAEVVALTQIANLSTDVSPVVPPYLAEGIERGRQWLQGHVKNANYCAGASR